MGRRAVVLLVAAVAAAGAVLAQTMPPAGPTYLPEAQTECWRCHTVPVGGAPGVVHFAAIVPPASAGAPEGEPFDYAVEVHNTWSGELTYVEPILDLTAAPSLGFVSDVPPVSLAVEDRIAVPATQPTSTHSTQVRVQLPDGLTHLRIRLEPANTDPLTGPDLTLNLTAGLATRVVDAAGPGAAEEFLIEGRAGFAGLGYGNWTLAAEVTPVSARPDELLAGGRPAPIVGDVPFRLVVEGEARESPDRVVGLPVRVSLVAGQVATATFRLVASAIPGPGVAEAAEARLHAHIHYTHTPQAQAVDDADLLAPAVPLHVTGAVGQVVVSSTAAPLPEPAMQNGATMATVAESIGYASGFLLLSSTWAGGLFGKASRRQLNAVFRSAKRRVAFHNFVSYGLTMAALAHTVLFLVEASYGWTVGLLWGGLAVLAMLGLGLTGALQVPMIRRWSFGSWRWSHLALALGAMLFTVAHVALDGVHFAEVQEALGWKDPLSAASP